MAGASASAGQIWSGGRSGTSCAVHRPAAATDWLGLDQDSATTTGHPPNGTNEKYESNEDNSDEQVHQADRAAAGPRFDSGRPHLAASPSAPSAGAKNDLAISLTAKKVVKSTDGKERLLPATAPSLAK
jgi:hypothetical protein